MINSFKRRFQRLSNTQATVVYVLILTVLFLILLHNPTKGYDRTVEFVRTASMETALSKIKAYAIQNNSRAEMRRYVNLEWLWKERGDIPEGGYYYIEENPWWWVYGYESRGFDENSIPRFIRQQLLALETLGGFLHTVGIIVIIASLFIWLMGIRKSSQKGLKTLQFYCKYCGKRIETSEDLAGEKTICHSCCKKIEVPYTHSAAKEEVVSTSPKYSPKLNRLEPANISDTLEPEPNPGMLKSVSNSSMPDSIPGNSKTSKSETGIGGKILSLVGTGILIIVMAFISRSCGGFIGKYAAENKISKRTTVQNSNEIDYTQPENFESILPEIVSKINERLPLMIDNDTRADRASAGPGRKVTYHYSLISQKLLNFDRNEVVAALREQLIEGYKKQDSLKYLRENDVTLDFKYVDINGNHFATITITPEDAK